MVGGFVHSKPRKTIGRTDLGGMVIVIDIHGGRRLARIAATFALFHIADAHLGKDGEVGARLQLEYLNPGYSSGGMF
jgi:hypothetical protein